MPAFQVPDHLGWHEQGDGKLYLGVPIASGRIVDDERSRIRTALREIVAEFRCDPILMPSQDIILSRDRPRRPRRDRRRVLREHGVRLAEDMLPVERWALACPALPSCGLALTEAERVRDDIVGAIAARLRRWGLEQRAAQHPHHRLPERLRPALYRRYRHRRPDAGLLLALCRRRFRGHAAQPGDRRAARHRTGIAEALDPLFALFAASRRAGEGFGDFCHRIGIFALQQVVAGVRRRAA